MKNNNLIIGIDFDGSCVKHEYPKIGDDIGAIPVLKELVNAGHKLILWTMRSDYGVKKSLYSSGLSDAVNWFKENDIPLFGIQRNPEQHKWTNSPKAYCHLYIDDAALGCPLVEIEDERPYIDWIKIREILIQKKII